MKKFLTLLAFMGLFSGAALAEPVKITLATLDTFVLLSSDPSVNTFAVTPSTAFNTPFTDFQANFVPGPFANAFARIGLAGSFDWTAFDSFALNIANSNETDWFFDIFFVDGNGVEFTSSTVSLAPGQSAVLSIDFAGLGANLNGVMAFGIRVSGSLPRDGVSDTTAEFRASPVPEPSSFLLLAAGIAFLGLSRRLF